MGNEDQKLNHYLILLLIALMWYNQILISIDARETKEVISKIVEIDVLQNDLILNR
jgi:hypothetical protein